MSWLFNKVLVMREVKYPHYARGATMIEAALLLSCIFAVVIGPARMLAPNIIKPITAAAEFETASENEDPPNPRSNPKDPKCEDPNEAGGNTGGTSGTC